ncbi:c-type cytochrome [bacterium]|nr:c-type cytochrome [bacterium]
MKHNTLRYHLTRTTVAISLLIGALALLFVVADTGHTRTFAQQQRTATAPAEEESTEPAATELAAEEETPSPADQPTVVITPVPDQEASGEEAEPSATATAEPLSDEELIETGSEIYSKYCAACHQAGGEGIPNAYPALAGNAFVQTEDPTSVLRVVFTGRAGMPHFRAAFTDNEIAGVVSFIRTAWDNDAYVVSAEEARTVEEEIYSPFEPMEHMGSSN